jgi:hypothetical protein
MKRLPAIAWLTAMAALLLPAEAGAQNRAAYEKMIAAHAKANYVPEALVHRVIVRESKYHPDLVGRGGTIGLMQIKLPTARGLGYQGDAEGLRDPDTNLTYGVKYLAGAWRAAEGDHDRAVHLYASGYYEVAKRQRLERARHPEPVLASARPRDVEAPRETTREASAEPKQAVAVPIDTATPDEVAKPEETATGPVAVTPKPETLKPETLKPETALKPKVASTTRKSTTPPSRHAFTPIDLLPSFLRPKSRPKPAARKLAEAKERVSHPSASMAAGASSGANAAKPR